MYHFFRFIWIVECRNSSTICIVNPVRSSSPGASRPTIAIERAAEISGNGMMARNSFIHSIQRGSTLRNMSPRSAASSAPYTRLSFSSCIGK
jgi:hypothetical protein